MKDLSIIERVCLNSVILDDTTLDAAFDLCHPHCKASADYRHTLALRWVRVSKTAATPQGRYILARRALLNEGVTGTPSTKSKQIDTTGNVNSKQAVLQELNNLYVAESDPKRKSDILMRISDLMRLKEEPTEADAELVHFFIPLTCSYCRLYAQLSRKEKSQFDDELNRIRPQGYQKEKK